MNEQKVKQAIEAIEKDVEARGWNQHKTTQKAWREMQEIGLDIYVPHLSPTSRRKGGIVVNEILAAAKQGGRTVVTGGWNDGGDGGSEHYEESASDLYLAMSETETEPAEAVAETSMITSKIYEPSDFIPTCPVCGMPGSRDDIVEYGCGHFVGQFVVWADDNSDRDDYAAIATHRIDLIALGEGSDSEFYYRATDTDEVMTAAEVAQRYNLESSTVRKAVERRSIPFRKSAGTILISREDADKKWGKPKAWLPQGAGDNAIGGEDFVSGREYFGCEVYLPSTGESVLTYQFFDILTNGSSTTPNFCPDDPLYDLLVSEGC